MAPELCHGLVFSDTILQYTTYNRSIAVIKLSSFAVNIDAKATKVHLLLICSVK